MSIVLLSSRDAIDQSDILGHPVRIQPADLLKRLPQLARLVHVDLAGLLGVRLAELLADAEGLDALDEDAALRRQVRRAVETQVAGQQDLVRVQEVRVRVVGEVEGHAAPLDLEGVGLLWQARQRRAVVGEGVEVLVLADDLLRGIRRRAGGLDGSGGLGSARQRWSLAHASSSSSVMAARGGDGRIATSLTLGLQVSAFPLEPQAGVQAEGAGDLRLELEGEGVVAGSWRGGSAEEALDAGGHMFLDGTLGSEGIVGGEEGRLLCGLGLGVRVEDGIADEGRVVVGGDALGDLGGRRDGGRDGEVRRGVVVVDGGLWGVEERLHVGVDGVVVGGARGVRLVLRLS